MSQAHVRPNEVRDLAGKTIEWARIGERMNGDAEFVLRFTDGSTATLAAWKRDGHAVQMGVDLAPNAHPQGDGASSARREM